MIVKKVGDGFEITWPVEPVPAAVYRKVRNYFLTTGYGPETPAEEQKIREIAAANDITVGQVISIRNITIKDKIIKGHPRMNALMPRIAADFASNTILQLSAKYDLPPLNLLRGILLHMGIPAGDIYRVFTYKCRPEEVLRGRLLEQYILAERNDANSNFNQDVAAERAAAAEAGFVAALESYGIPLRTQEELATEQIREHGRAVNTPDVLFAAPVSINGKSVAWIDYKDYMGTPASFLLRSNSEQAGRYKSEWGPGALCYSHSFVEGLDVAGALLLDGAVLHAKK